MDTIRAIAMSFEALRAGVPQRVFDWNKAAEIIKGRQPTGSVEAGLKRDMEWTSGTIWSHGRPVFTSYTYLSSNWDTPILVIGDEEIECFTSQEESGFESATKWPDSALQILGIDPATVDRNASQCAFDTNGSEVLEIRLLGVKLA